jgi:hypothetical protein
MEKVPLPLFGTRNVPADATCGCPALSAPAYQHSYHGESPEVLRCRTVRVIFQLPDASDRATAVPEAVCVDPGGGVRLKVTTSARPPLPRLSGMTMAAAMMAAATAAAAARRRG